MIDTTIQPASPNSKGLRTMQPLKPECFQRTGNHTTDSPLTQEMLLARITNHIPHHIKIVEEERVASVGQ